MLIENKRIAIVGGGPGGLTLARLLQIKGADVKVYERDLNRDVRVQGATLDLHYESGLEALRRAGLMGEFKANYRPGADRIRIVDGKAVVFFDEHNGEIVDDFEDQYFRPEIDRGPLRNILLDSLEPGTVIWDSQFLSMSAEGEGWKLDFKNGTSAAADLVIGADGANSKIRPFITPAKPFYSGVTVIEGTVYDAKENTPDIFELLNDGKIFALANNKTLVVSSKGDGSLAFYAGWKTNENWIRESGLDFSDKSQLLSWFKQEYSDWDSLWHELFLNDSTQFMPRQINSMPLDQRWETKPNLTLLGDAAHLMPPYAGEGVNMAMQDAFELAEKLTEGDCQNLHTAIAKYEVQMRCRASEVTSISLESTKSLHSPVALQWMLEMFAL
ncbi:FAD-dependent monooxygenase [Pedobacter sp. HMF7647]|uniref:Flavin-dependent monooxygenase n=1 Tax=Hufsiella arboris TaxID=2695275 RepID=A0A7K1YCN8_9SPHI|nr:NAD(P)/FAD-dependent oxidoreductase [Hufsiella arboris]MXV52352.1 FAD-dependent monooxygenase [Hufsiella arboris]